MRSRAICGVQIFGERKKSFWARKKKEKKRRKKRKKGGEEEEEEEEERMKDSDDAVWKNLVDLIDSSLVGDINTLLSVYT